MDIKWLLAPSVQQAKSIATPQARTSVTHAHRSQTWIETLATNFRNLLADDQQVRVFSKYTESHRSDFGLNELRYDILVCRVAVVPSARHAKPLYYIQDGLWQVEAEMARDSRQALVDFNKLVRWRGENKLCIGPQVHDNYAFLDTLLPVARRCTNTVYAGLIPHPRQWDSTDSRVDVWQLGAEQWQPL